MTASAHETGSAMLADYCGMLREAAFLLAELAEASEDERLEEFDALAGVEVESRHRYGTVRQALAEDSGAWADHARDVTKAVHRLFGGLIHTGSVLVDWPAPSLPTEVLEQCRQVELGSRALARAWEGRYDPDAVERDLHSIRESLAAADRMLAELAAPMPLILATEAAAQ